MKMIVKTLFVVFAFASSAFGFTCPVPETTPGADIGKIAGQWNRINGTTLTSIDTWIFTPREDAGFEIKVPGITETGEKFSAIWYGRRTDNQNLLNIYFDVSKEAPVYLSLNVVATDYDNYLAGYLCWLYRTEFLFGKLIVSRTNTLNVDKYTELDALLTDKVGNIVVPSIQKD